jgi:hypothetical protein
METLDMSTHLKRPLGWLAISLALMACGAPVFSVTALADKPDKPSDGDDPLVNPAFVLEDVDDGGVFLLSSDGAERQRLTNPKGKSRDVAPAWSPDPDGDPTNGHQGVIAFLRHPDETKIWSDLYTVRPDGLELTFIRSFDSWDVPIPCQFSRLTWSPDGSRIGYSAHDSLWAVCGNGDLEPVLHAPEVLYETHDPTFSPDLDTETPGYQGELAFAGLDISFQLDIWLLKVAIDTDGNFATGELVKLTDSATSQGLPAWSPDGQYLAYTEFGEVNKVFLLDMMTGRTQFVVSPLSGNAELTWSPDCEFLGFDDLGLGRGSRHDLFYISPWGANTTPVNVTQTARCNEARMDWNPAWVNDIDL